MGRKSDPFPPYPKWTTARFFGFLRSGLRQLSSRYPPRFEVLAAARRPSQSDNKRLKWEFQCAVCGQWFPQKLVSVDHIVPTGTLKTMEDLPGFVERLFVGHAGLQVICDEHHQEKTNSERAAAKGAADG